LACDLCGPEHAVEVIHVVSGSITPAAVTRRAVLTDRACNIQHLHHHVTPTTADIINGLFIEVSACRVDAAFVKMIYLSVFVRLVYSVVNVLSVNYYAQQLCGLKLRPLSRRREGEGLLSVDGVWFGMVMV